MANISEVSAREVLDSRGSPTLDCTVLLEDGSRGSAMVPSGASTGIHEAVELRDGGKRFLGRGVLNAVTNIRKVMAPKLVGREAGNQRELDAFLVELDGTPTKKKLGANAILGISLASARASAASENHPLYVYLQELYGSPSLSIPVPFANLLNGGKHAGNALSIQEFMIAPVGAKNGAEATRMVAEVYSTLKKQLKNRMGSSSINVGDEGGFAPPFTKTAEALNAIVTAINELGYSKHVRLAMDAAASSFYMDGSYSMDGRSLSTGELTDYYADLINNYSLLSLEDPFHEEDFEAYATLTKRFSNVQVVADDLTVTNTARLKTAVEKNAGNCLLLKVNQIGTLSESFEAARLAVNHKWGVMVSHRSGETEDAFIADLAVAMDCKQIKLGAPCRGERTSKYNRLLQIEEALSGVRFSWIR